MNEEQDYDVVIETLQKQIDIIWKITESNMNIMDDIRLQQIDELEKVRDMLMEIKDAI